MAEAQELRVQPHDLVAEQSVLGAIFINPEKLITVREFIEADDFYKYSHRVIFKAMVRDGADTFWELYNPYNKFESPYGSVAVNSFCHAWSCTPTYFLRKFYI